MDACKQALQYLRLADASQEKLLGQQRIPGRAVGLEGWKNGKLSAAPLSGLPNLA